MQCSKKLSDFFMDLPVRKYPLPYPCLDHEEAIGHVITVPLANDCIFPFLLRNTRSARGISQKEAAQVLKCKNAWSYRRLEQKCNPNLFTIFKILSVFPEFPLNFLFENYTINNTKIFHQ